MKKTIMYLMALMVTFSLVPSCNEEEEPAPWEVVNPDDGGGKDENEENTDDNEQGDAPVQIKLINASSSTLTVEWNVNGSQTQAEALNFNLEIFKDEACTDLVVSWLIDKDLFLYTSSSGTASNHKWVRFTFADLDQGTDYWIKITAQNNPETCSVAYKATTKTFDYTAVTGTGTATVGSVLVAEDFHGFIHGGDMAFNAIALYVETENRGEYKHSTGVNPTDYAHPIAFGTEFNLFTNSSAAYLQGTGLADWCIGDGTNTSTRSGYAKLGGGSNAYGYLATPELTAIPEGYAAKVKVSCDVLSYNEDTNKGDYGNYMQICAIDNVEVNVTDGYKNQAVGWTTSSDSAVPVDSQVLDIQSAIGGENADHAFYPFEATLDGVTNTCRIRISSDTGHSGIGTRFLLDNIVITVEELYESNPLGVPANLKAEFDEDALTIKATWDAVEDAESYTLAYTIGDGEEMQVSTENTEYSLSVNSFGVDYTFKVRAESGTKVSEWSDDVTVEVSADAEPDPETPKISNLREGLGWLNITVENIADYDYVVYDSNAASDFEAEFMKDNGDGTYEFSISGLDLNTTYSTLSIKAVSKNNSEKISDAASITTFTTANLWADDNTSPCNLTFEWDDTAANLNWTTTESKTSYLERTFWIQLATDENFNNLVYDMATVASSSEGTYSKVNWNGGTGASGASSGTTLLALTGAAFGNLQPSTTYYFRVRNAADETYQGAALAATNGKSAWSPAITATTQPSHTPATGELLFQGFDDSCWQYDLVNSVCGIIPNSGTWTVGGNHVYFLQDMATGQRYDQIGAASSSPSGQFPFTTDGLLESDNNGLYKIIDDVIPSLNGWYVSKACYPMQGACRIGSSTNSNRQTNVLIPPAFDDLTEATTVTISCDAGTSHVNTSQYAKLQFGVFRVATNEYEDLGDVISLQTEAPVVVKEGTLQSGDYAFRPLVGLKPFSCETTLQPGDYVVFKCITDSYSSRMLIDNLSVVKK